MTDKKLLVLGATGGTGRLLVEQALRRQFVVTAFVRDAARITIKSDRLSVRIGDMTGDETTLASAMHGQDAVISALGVGKSFRSGGIIEQSVPRIVRCMEAAGVRRIVFTSGFGVGETRRDVPPIPRLFMSTLLRGIYRDKAAGEVVLRRSALDWTIVYATTLADRAATGKYQIGERIALRGVPSIARADLAAILLDQVDDATYVRKGVMVSN